MAFSMCEDIRGPDNVIRSWELQGLSSHWTEVTACSNPALVCLEVLPGAPWREGQWNQVSSIDREAQPATHYPGQYTLFLFQHGHLALGKTSAQKFDRCHSMAESSQQITNTSTHPCLQTIRAVNFPSNIFIRITYRFCFNNHFLF